MNMQKILQRSWVLILGGTVSFLGGCASIISGSSQELNFQSNPNDVTVTINGKVTGKTPVTIRTDKKSGQSVVFSKDGFKPVTMLLTTNLEPWFWGNVVFGGFFGSTTDSLSGAMHQYSPNQYYITLEPVTTSSFEAPTAVSRQVRVTAFVVMRHQEILADLNRGQGENLDALAALLEITPDKKSEEMTRIGTLASSNPDTVVFANQVVQQYLSIVPHQSPAVPHQPPAPATVRPSRLDAFGRGALVVPTF